MAADIVYPILIGVGALLLGVAVHFLTRPKPSRADIAVPGSPANDAPTSATSTSELGAWHRTHESALLRFIDRVDTLAGFGPDNDDRGGDVDGRDPNGGVLDNGATSDDSEDDATATNPEAEAIDAAISDHPAPDMRAELAALRGAADAMADARERDDSEALDRHLPVYLSYRAAWLERLWQFPVHSARIAEIRERDVPAVDED